MFLPALLMRDMGWAGLAIFAVPNSLGAAAFGTIFRDKNASASFLLRHHRAAILFSSVTAVFQLFFGIWIATALLRRDDSTNVLLLSLAVAAGATLALRWTDSAAVRRCAVVVTSLSIACMLLAIGLSASTSGEELQGPLLTDMPDTSPGSTGWLFLAPVCLFGFSLCPLLDLTFHRVRQATPAACGRMTFLVGFLVIFPTLIFFTLLYGPLLVRGMPVVFALSESSLPLILAHIGLQLGYTAGLHWHAARTGFSRRPSRRHLLGVGVLLAAVVAAFAGSSPLFWGDLVRGEVVYRVLMACYGLVFPAYVWIIHRSTAQTLLQRRTLLTPARLYFFAIAAAAPFYWVGFIERQWIWLSPGLLIVLAVPLLLKPSRAS